MSFVGWTNWDDIEESRKRDNEILSDRLAKMTKAEREAWEKEQKEVQLFSDSVLGCVFGIGFIIWLVFMIWVIICLD
jgi:hypothetical protein